MASWRDSEKTRVMEVQRTGGRGTDECAEWGGPRPAPELHPRSFGKLSEVLTRAVMVPASQQTILEGGGGHQWENGLWHLDWGAGCGKEEVCGSGRGLGIKEWTGRAPEWEQGQETRGRDAWRVSI